MNFDNQLELAGVKEWHEKGITGKGISIFMDDVSAHGHNALTYSVLQEVVPDATIYTGNIGFETSGGIVTRATIRNSETNKVFDFDEFIVNNNIKLITNSTDGGSYNVNDAKNKFMREKIKEHNFILFGAAGNGYKCKITNPYYGSGIMVSGVNNSKKSTYAYDDGIDFVEYTAEMSGTSFASPFLCGMAGLLLCKHPDYTQEDIYDYFKDYCEDLGIKGKDNIYGWGLAYMGECTTNISIGIGDNYMMVDGKKVALDQPAVIDSKTNRTLVPVRAISEALGATVDWDNKTRTVLITL